MFNIEFGEL